MAVKRKEEIVQHDEKQGGLRSEIDEIFFSRENDTPGTGAKKQGDDTPGRVDMISKNEKRRTTVKKQDEGSFFRNG